MKIFVLTNSDTLSLLIIKKLEEDGVLNGLGIPKRNQTKILPALNAVGIPEDKVLLLERKSWLNKLKVFFDEEEIETVWVLTFPWIIPQSLLSLMPNRFVNFHFGLLPKYKGADPIFWQLKNREELGGITVHLMNDKIDEGPVLLKEELRIIPGENYGLHCKRLGELGVTLIGSIVQKLELQNPEFIELNPLEGGYHKSPDFSDLTIRWKRQTADEIESLVNATNPKYSGANTVIAGFEMRILEVTPVNMESHVEAEPGQIVHADTTYGLVVACINNEFLRITIAQTADGYLSGVRLFNLGFSSGHQFIS